MTTQDMAFAAYLVGLGHKITSVVRQGRRVSWVFDVTDEDLSSAEASWPSCAESQFFNIYQTLKNQIRKA
jgi:hypothetical protein